MQVMPAKLAKVLYGLVSNLADARWRRPQTGVMSHLTTHLQECSDLHFHHALGKAYLLTPCKLGKKENSPLISCHG